MFSINLIEAKETHVFSVVQNLLKSEKPKQLNHTPLTALFMSLTPMPAHMPQ